MKGPGLHVLAVGPEPVNDLARGPVREGDGHDLARRHALTDQVPDSLGQDPGLPRPRAGQDHERTARVGHGLILGIV